MTNNLDHYKHGLTYRRKAKIYLQNFLSFLNLKIENAPTELGDIYLNNETCQEKNKYRFFQQPFQCLSQLSNFIMLTNLKVEDKILYLASPPPPWLV